MFMRFMSRSFLAASLLAIAAPGQLLAQAPAAPGAVRIPDQIKAPIVESDTVQLYGNTYPMARAEYDRGAVASDYRFDKLMVLLETSPAQRAELDNLAAAQQNPASPSYHKWITRAEYATRFGVSSSDLNKVTGWLKSHGFTIDQVAPGGRLLYISGTEASIESAFHTQVHRYVIDGVAHLANNQDPQIPRALAPVVRGPVSLHDFRRTSMLSTKRLGPQPEFNGNGSTHYLYPADYGVIYDLATTWGTNTGTGVTIGIVGRSNIYPGDITHFRSSTSLTTNAAVVDLGANGGSDPGLVSGDQDEATLDVEWSGAVAPAATIKLAPAASTNTTDGVDLSAAYLVQTIATLPPIISVSFGSCESAMGSTELAFYNSLWEQAATQGQSALVSSGDSGAAGCDAHAATVGTRAGVNGLCTSPYSTCVGGTEFNDTANPSTYWASSNGTAGKSALSYIPEVVWNESKSNGGSGLWSSGGGISIAYPQPSWQTGTGTSATNGMRGVPDVSLTAASHDGYMTYETPGGSSGTPSWYVDSGTSAAAPSFAGILALIVKAGSLAGQGNINPILYPLTTATHNPFHPTPSGNNDVPGVSGYSATGNTYNLATGLGSVDGGKLLTAWAASEGNSGFTLTPSANSSTVVAGSTATVTLAVGSFDGETPSVALSATAPAGVTVTFNHPTVTASATASSVATIAAGANVQPGNYFIVFNGVAGTNSQTATVALTVTATPTLSVHGATDFTTVTQGSTKTVAYTITTGGTFTGNVTLAASGLPTGVTASWSSSPVTPSSNVGTSTLTLTASSTAKVSIGNVTITATGDGLTATDTLDLQVLQAEGIEVSSSVSTLSMASAGSASAQISVYTVGGLSGAVALSVSGLPTGITGTFSPSTLASPGSGISTLKLTGSNAAAAGTATVTVTATATDSNSNTFHQTATIALTVTKSPATLNFSGGSTAQVSVVQGATATNVVTLLTGGSFTGTVSLAVSGLPTGVTGSWSSTTITPSGGTGTATLTLTATSTAAVPTSPVAATITATSNSISTLKATQTLDVTVVYSPKILVSASVASIAMNSAQTGVTDVFTITPVGGYVPTSITATVPTFPTGITGVFSNISNAGVVTLSNSGGATSTLTLTGSNVAIASNISLTLTLAAVDANSVASTATITVPLKVTLSPPTLAVTAASNAISVEQGYSATDVITITGGGSFAPSSTAALTVTGLPTGVTASFSTTPVTPTGVTDSATSTLTLTAAPGATVPTTPTTITVTATGQGSESTAVGTLKIPVTLTYAPSQLLTLGSSTLTMSSASTTTEKVTITNEGGLVPSSTVLTVSGLPSGITGSFSAIASGVSTLTLTGSNTAAASASNTLTITATAEDSHGNFYVSTATVPLTVNLSAPTLSIAPASSGGSATASVVQGGNTTDAFTITAGGSFNTAVTLSVSNLPSGVTATWSASPVLPTFSGTTGTASSTLTLTASSTATASATAVPVVVTAAGDGKTATTTVNLTVNYAPAVQVSVSQATPTVVSLANAASVGTVTVKGVGGVATSGVTLAASGLPTGMTAAFGALSSAGVATMTLTGANTVAAGSYLVTITGSASYTPSGGSAETITGTATQLLTVTLSAATLTISPASAAVTVSVGTSPFDVTDVITATGGGSFSGAVTFSVSGLPTGITASWDHNPITPTYSSTSMTSTGTATLTFTAGSSAVASSTPAHIVVTASGDGLTHTTTINLTVAP